MINRKKIKGFSLIELMVAVAIIGIISSIAIPGYYKYVQRGERADCKQFISMVAQAEERFYSDFNTYTTTLVAPGGCADDGCGLGYTSDMSSRQYCQVSIQPLPGSTIARSYVISGDIVDPDDLCDVLTYDSRGRKENAGGLPDDACW